MKKEDHLEIPVSAAKHIADTFGHDQVVIIAIKVGDNGGEAVTTYGTDKTNCKVAARIGNFLKYEVMKWERNRDNSGADAEEHF